MSKKRASARSSNAAQAFGISSPSFGGFGSPNTFSSTTSQLSYVAEPPDLSQISDSHLVVLFKNLSKKDDITKAKALEDLQNTFSSSTDVEEPVLTAWIRLYPRLSTDVSRRVRQLAHTVHGIISQRAGRELAKHMPKVVGVWLAGLYDNDQATSRAARDALKAVFITEEKVGNVWRHYHATILLYCTDVILNETVNSLSDERQVSPDDAESKFARVIATCVLTVGHLISELPSEELTKQDSAYHTLFSNPHLWAFTHHTNPFLRKALYKFLQSTLQKRPDLISTNLDTIATELIIKSLPTPQIGSVTDFLDTLIDLTVALPAAWTTIKPPKKHTPITLIQRFIKLGSQTGGLEYWGKISKLISTLPSEILPTTIEGVKGLLDAIVDGIKNGPEPRSHLVAAWGAYFSCCYHLLSLVSSEEEMTGYILKEAIYPFYKEYLLAADPGARLAVPHHGAAICASGIAMAGVQSERVMELIWVEVWQKITNLVLQGIKNEPVTEEKAVVNVKEVGQRWGDLVSGILARARAENPVVEVVRAAGVDVLVASIEAVVAEKGKRTDVVGLLEIMVGRFGEALLGVEEVKKAITTFFENLPELLASPSLTQVLDTLINYRTYTSDSAAFQSAWKTTIQSILLSPHAKETKETAILQLLQTTPQSAFKGTLPPVLELDRYITNKLQTSLATDDAAGWDITKSAFRSIAVSNETKMAILTTLTSALSLTEEDRAPKVCQHLRAVAKRDPASLAWFACSEHGAGLMWRLMGLLESSDKIVVAAARDISRVVEQGLASSSSNKDQVDRVVGSLVDIIVKSVREPEDVELSLRTLAWKTRHLIWRMPEGERAGWVERLLFDKVYWKTGLKPFSRRAPEVALAITNPVGGCVFLVEEDVEDVGTAEPVVRDGQGVSSALRMGIFATEFLKVVDVCGDDESLKIFSSVSEEARSNLLFYLTLTLELAKDNVGITGTNDLWTGNSTEVETEVLEFVSSTQQFVAKFVKEGEAAVHLTIDRLMETSLEQNTKGFYAARVLAGLISDLAEHQMVDAEKVQGWIKSVNVRKGTDVFRSIAILTGLSESLEHSKDADRLRNELASDLTGVPASKAGDEGLRKLIFLNAVLPKPGEDTTPLPPQRTIFLIKHLLSWFEDEAFASDPNLAVITEAAKVFASILPAINSLYGEHWQSLCDFIVNCWQMCVQMGDQDVPVVFATLKLFQALKSSRHENDDIEDAWNNSAASLYSALINLLRNSHHADEQHLPRNLCNTLMARQTKAMDLKYLEPPNEIYPLLNVKSRPIQEAAFELLHRHIPSAQEQVSIDAAFSKEDTFQLQLPAELLSLVLEPPTIATVEELSFARSMPLTLRGYLLTWILIFDHFDNSSFKVKLAYVENLKEGGYLTGLLDFVFDFLSRAGGKLIDASRFQIEEYNLDEKEDPEKDTQWLLIHLYYLSLRFTPSLAKNWWLDCKSRQKVLLVEEFTKKYMSPLIIDKELQSVRAWIQEQPASAPGGEEQEMQVKISRGAAKEATTKEVMAEVTAVYPIDDQKMEMVVRLPSTFPLKPVKIEGVERVGLNKEEFRKLQMASQAMINFNSASIIDGLTLFRKNVQLHIEGVAECAICYSILAVTPDRALPKKACSTCKHKFHSTCLLKWFKTSNSSSCPLCRTSFSFY